MYPPSLLHICQCVICLTIRSIVFASCKEENSLLHQIYVSNGVTVEGLLG